MHEGEELSLVTRWSDGQMLFLADMASKMNGKSALGSRIAAVHHGSSLFTGDAGQAKATSAAPSSSTPASGSGRCAPWKRSAPTSWPSSARPKGCSTGCWSEAGRGDDLAQGGIEGVVDRLTQHLARSVPGQRGFTRRNLFRMRQFFEAYRDDERLSTPVRELPWTHNLVILGQSKRVEEREFYLRIRAAAMVQP